MSDNGQHKVTRSRERVAGSSLMWLLLAILAVVGFVALLWMLGPPSPSPPMAPPPGAGAGEEA